MSARVACNVENDTSVTRIWNWHGATEHARNCRFSSNLSVVQRVDLRRSNFVSVRNPRELVGILDSVGMLSEAPDDGRLLATYRLDPVRWIENGHTWVKSCL